MAHSSNEQENPPSLLRLVKLYCMRSYNFKSINTNKECLGISYIIFSLSVKYFYVDVNANEYFYIFQSIFMKGCSLKIFRVSMSDTSKMLTHIARNWKKVLNRVFFTFSDIFKDYFHPRIFLSCILKPFPPGFLKYPL